MSEITDKLKSSDNSVTNLELLNHVIAFQLDKIENYHTKSNKIPNTVNEKAENAMSNLIELLKLRENYRYE